MYFIGGKVNIDQVSPKAMQEAVIEVIKQTKANKSSMLQDFENRRRTEIDYLNGYVVKMANTFGIPCRANELIVDIVHKNELQYLSQLKVKN